ncbi:MAG: hypothetical protein HOQ34_07455, partial [Gemmatimonadaceae bacterium]|nr:hypothetical protein [Gemmatimonadaceae bacterium]
MSTHLAGIRRAIAATAWAIAPDKGAALLEVVGLRASGARLSDAEIEQRIGAARDALTTRREAAATRATGGPGAKIAVLPLYGVISHRMNLMADISGGTSTEQFAAQFDAAVNDPSVSAIVLDIDSPGGSIAGVPELAKKIFDAQGKKPIVAVCNALMASAAYWIGSAADEIVITPSGEAGSIGVFCVHEDISQAAADAGVKFTIVKAGKYKAEGNPYEPLSDEAKAALQASVDDAYEQFVGAVAKHRGVKSASVKAGFGQGRCLPAQASVDAGLCDRVATLESVLADLGAKKGFGRSVASASSAAPARAAATTTLGTTGGVTIHVEPMLDAADARQMDALAHAIRALADRNIVIRHADLAPSTEPGDEPGADEAALCPNCGAPLDADGDCPACGWEAPGPDPDEAPEGAPAALDSPSSPAPEAKEHTVSTNPTAATNGAAPDANSVLLAERERVKELRAIAQSNGVDAATLEAWEHAGTSAKDAAYEVSKKKQAARAASPDIRVGADREAEKPFKTAGEQLFAIMQSARGRTDKRLLFVNEQAQRMAGTPSGMNESVGAEGGFFIQHDLLPGIIDPV